MKKHYTISMLCLLAFTLTGFAQEDNPFAKLFLKKIIYKDLPDQVKVYADSSDNYLAYYTYDYDVNDRIKSSRIDYMFGHDTIFSSIYSTTWYGDTMTIGLNNGLEVKSRETILYKDNLPVRISFDTLDGNGKYNPFSYYAISYDANNQIQAYDLYESKDNQPLTLHEKRKFVYNLEGNLISDTVMINGNVMVSSYFYDNNSLDSILVKYIDGLLIHKSFPHYKDGTIDQVVNYWIFNDTINYSGTDVFYNSKIAAIEKVNVLECIKCNNPVSDNLTLQNCPEGTVVSIIDLNGNCVLKTGHFANINLEKLTRGFYLLQFSNKESTYSIKLLKQ